MFGRIGLRLAALNVTVLLLVVALVVSAIYLGVKAGVRRDTVTDLRRAARALATSRDTIAILHPAEHATPAIAAPPGRQEEDAGAARTPGAGARDDRRLDADEPGAAEGPEPRPDVLAASPLPGYILGSAGELVQGVSTEHGELPQTASAAEALRGHEDIRRVLLDDGPTRVLSLPVVDEGRIVGAVQVYKSEAAIEDLLRTLLAVLAAVGVAGAAVAAGGGLLLAARAMRPVSDAFNRQRAFIADASHELRTPAAVIRADADALERTLGTLPRKDAELLQDLQHEAGYVGLLVDRLLDVARLDTGAEASAPERFDLSDLARDGVRAVSRLAANAGLSASFDESGAGGPLEVSADPVQLRRALLALLENAIRYTPTGGEVSVAIRRDGHDARLGVSDTGIGMSAGEIGAAFRRLYRADKARSRAEGSMGLGLSIARALVEANGGRITLESEPGRGTTATISLPLA